MLSQIFVGKELFTLVLPLSTHQLSQSNHKSVRTKGQPQKQIMNATLTNLTAGTKKYQGR